MTRFYSPFTKHYYLIAYDYTLLLLLLCTIVACNNKPSLDTPIANKFSVEPRFVEVGDQVTISWQVDAKKVWLNEKEVNSSGKISAEITAPAPFKLKWEDRSGHQLEQKIEVQTYTQELSKGDYPILFVTQVPIDHDKNTRLSAFGNHRSRPQDVPRGGDLMLWYPDGQVRNLTKDAGYGNLGLQANRAIAVREPNVHWSGEKALFSMLVGAPIAGNKIDQARWQIYEVTGLGDANKKQIVQIRRIETQDPQYNNVSPIYDADDNIIFTSDRPRTGQAHLYPQLDEYEATPSVSGLWKLHRNGQLQLLSHTPSGAFQPIIDRFGRVLFTRWDHLQQDQLADRDRDASRNGVKLPFNSFNFASEAKDAVTLPHRDEIFPESRVGGTGPYGTVSAYRNNFFAIWQIDQDGGNEETINHLGLHELSFGYVAPSFIDDPALAALKPAQFHQNQINVKREGGLFHLTEDPLKAGRYFATRARESGSFTTDSIVSFEAPPGMNPEQIKLTAITPLANNDRLSEGRFRNPLPLSNGKLLAAHTSDQLPPEENRSLQQLRLRFLERGDDGLYHPGTSLTKGIHKKLQWWDGQKMRQFDGILWELEAVEVRPRPRSASVTSNLEAPELSIFNQERVAQAELVQWLKDNKLALLITRDQTSRDRADHEQPINLAVKGGKQTLATTSPTQGKAKVYELSHFQFLQAEQVRAYADRPGRRHLAQTIPDFQSPINGLGMQADKAGGSPSPASSVKIFPDGSTAAFVPAERALTWQTTDAQGIPIVRERNWVSFKAGEIRVCTSCHGVNQSDQGGFAPPINPPEALRDLLQQWKIYRQKQAK